MHARVMSAKIKPGCLARLERVVKEEILPEVAEQRGYRGGWALVDTSSGSGMLVTFWETASDLEATECSGLLTSNLIRVSKYLDGPAVRETFEVILEHP